MWPALAVQTLRNCTRPTRQFDLYAQLAILRSRTAGVDRQIGEIGRRVVGHLVAVRVDGLGEIALAVQQADPDERDVEIAGRLAVVAGQDAETAGVDLETFVETEFGAEIRDQVIGSRSSCFSIAGRARSP